MRLNSFRLMGIVVGAIGLVMLAMPGSAAADEASELEAIRKATEKYKDVNVALADGYITPPPVECVSAAHEGLPPELGAMGIHYINPALLKITAEEPRVDGMSTHTDFLNPAILIYEPQADGSLVLVGVENLVFQKAWKEAGNSTPPSFAGSEWNTMADDPKTPDDEAHAFEPHFDLHLWVFRDNPTGVRTPFNPNVTCEHHKGHTD